MNELVMDTGEKMKRVEIMDADLTRLSNRFEASIFVKSVFEEKGIDVEPLYDEDEGVPRMFRRLIGVTPTSAHTWWRDRADKKTIIIVEDNEA